jgi:N-acetylneuraminic acid mutarotase
LGTWTTGTSLPGALYYSQAIVTNSRVYLLGGYASGTASAVVYTAPINSDGTLGTWTTGTSLPGALYYSQAIVTNSRVYLLGGYASGTASAVVYTAPFADGWNGVNDTNAIGKSYLNRYSSQNVNKVTTVNDITGWTTGTSLPATVYDSQAIVTNSRVYSLGGNVSGVVSAVVYTAPINSDGTLGTWTTGTSLPATISQSQAIVTNSRVYLLGGYVSGAVSAVVYTAPINSDGTLGTWTTGTSLPATVYVSQAIVTNSRVYLLGSASSAVYTAPINSDGTLGTWTTGTSLPGTVAYSQAIVTNSRVYLLGGQINGTDSATVYIAPINSDGTLGTWTTGTSLPATVYASQAIVTNSRVYLLGGQISGAASAVVYTAPINSDGTLGTWTTGTSLPGTIYGSQPIVTNGRVHLLGGVSAVVYTAPFADGWNGVNDATQISYTATMSSTLPVLPTLVYRAGQYSQSSLHLQGTSYKNNYTSQNLTKTTTVNDITGWTVGTALPATVYNSQVLVTSSRVYLLGGVVAGSTSSTVYIAPINSDGTLGTWGAGVSLPGLLSGSTMAVTTNRVYLLGGFDSIANTSVVYTAPINADGTLGTWTTGTSLPLASQGNSSVVVNGKVHWHSGNSTAVYYSSIASDGTLGAWTAGPTLPTVINLDYMFSTVTRVYHMASGTSNIYYALINTDGTLGTWTTQSVAVTSIQSAKILVTASRVFAIGGVTSATVQSAPIDNLGVVGVWATNATPLTVTTNAPGLIVTNSKVFTLGGVISGTNSAAVYSANFVDGWNGVNTALTNTPIWVTDGITSEVISNDTVTMTCNQRLGNGQYAQVQIGMNNQDVSTELKATLTF